MNVWSRAPAIHWSFTRGCCIYAKRVCCHLCSPVGWTSRLVLRNRWILYSLFILINNNLHVIIQGLKSYTFMLVCSCLYEFSFVLHFSSFHFCTSTDGFHFKNLKRYEIQSWWGHKLRYGIKYCFIQIWSITVNPAPPKLTLSWLWFEKCVWCHDYSSAATSWLRTLQWP